MFITTASQYFEKIKYIYTGYVLQKFHKQKATIQTTDKTLHPECSALNLTIHLTFLHIIRLEMQKTC